MSGKNVEIVRRVYAAMNAGDLSGVIELATPDMEWVPDPRVGEGPVRGRENVIKFFTDRASMFGEFTHEIERAWEQDEQVLVFLLVTGTGATSDAGFEIHIAHLWTLRDGVLARGQGFGDRSEALEATGLRE
jgi:ketosteroid isomerase-like protein